MPTELPLRLGLAIALAIAAGAPRLAAQVPVPDLTQGGSRDESHDWTLGPTGARGWIAGRNLETTLARQILVTKVEDGSPADGVLRIGDVILGVDGVPFARDARKAFGAAITEAERDENRGILDVLRWREGKVDRAKLRLEVLGSYRDTSPEDCPKTRRIVERACQYLARRGLGDSIPAAINALGLLAAGRPEDLAAVGSLARSVGSAALVLDPREGMSAWTWGIHNLFLCEYFLATGDRAILPAIRAYSTAIAEGQSDVGTWGHGMALAGSPRALGGYGAINQTGLACWLSLVLAQRCGVKDPAIDRAVATSRRFVAFYVGKGSIPYGDHAPYHFLHDNNGKNALAAVAFDLLGDGAATRFFSRMSTASHAERELGHTGNYFGYLWGPLGVARAGNEALAAHLKEQRWFYDLARRWDGGFVYQGGAGESDSYENWDTTGAFLLTYAVPRRRLFLAGKGVRPENALAGDALRAAIEEGRGFDAWHVEDGYRSRPTAELLASLASPSPAVRFRAANALALDRANVVPQLVAMLEGSDLDARYGACQALERMGKDAAPAVDALIAQLSHGDPWLQIRAAFALADIGKPARKAVPALLSLVLRGTPGDPRETARRYLGLALFLGDFLDTGPRRGLLADSLEGVDRAALVAAIQRLLETDDGLVRSQVASVFDDLSEEEMIALGPDILRAVRTRPPSGEMYADGIRVAGLQWMAKHGIREGMQACVDYARQQNPWGSETRMASVMGALRCYGAAAQEMLPQLRELAEQCRAERDFPEDCKKKKVEAVEEAVAAIAIAKDRPALRSLAPRAPAPAQSRRARERLEVFVLAGQSNMEGPAVADLDPSWNRKDYNDGRGTLEQVMREPRNIATYRHLKDGRGNWTVREDVWVHYRMEDGALRCGPLAPGFSPHGPHHFGPELQFGHVVGQAFEAPVLLVKTAWGGKSLFEDFRPPSSGGAVGPSYTKMIQQIRDALANLPKDFPAYQGGGYELAGFVWYQGWNDGCGPESAVAEYEQNLVNLIRDVRRDLGAPRLPVVVGELTGPWVRAEGEWAALRRAQAAAAARPEFAGTVAFAETHDFVRKPEDSPHPGHGHHEFGNAETYFLVGDALGRAMVSLCAAAANR